MVIRIGNSGKFLAASRSLIAAIRSRPMSQHGVAAGCQTGKSVWNCWCSASSEGPTDESNVFGNQPTFFLDAINVGRPRNVDVNLVVVAFERR